MYTSFFFIKFITSNWYYLLLLFFLFQHSIIINNYYYFLNDVTDSLHFNFYSFWNYFYFESFWNGCSSMMLILILSSLNWTQKFILFKNDEKVENEKFPYFFLLFWIIILIFSLIFQKVNNLMIDNFWIYSINWLYFLYNFDQMKKIVNH